MKWKKPDDDGGSDITGIKIDFKFYQVIVFGWEKKLIKIQFIKRGLCRGMGFKEKFCGW